MLPFAVMGFPRFSWGEASYLRTQIARIAAGTSSPFLLPSFVLTICLLRA